MKIEFTVTHSDGAGTRYESGEVYDVPEELAKDVVARGYGHVVSSASRKAAKRTATRRAPRTAGGDAKGTTKRDSK